MFFCFPWFLRLPTSALQPKIAALETPLRYLTEFIHDGVEQLANTVMHIVTSRVGALSILVQLRHIFVKVVLAASCEKNH